MWRRTFLVGVGLLVPRSAKANPAYVIAAPCIDVKDLACVDACPVDCIHPKRDSANFKTVRQLFINPVECIDCGACVPVCPKSAIFALDDLPKKWREYAELNARYYKRPKDSKKKGPQTSKPQGPDKKQKIK